MNCSEVEMGIDSFCFILSLIIMLEEDSNRMPPTLDEMTPSQLRARAAWAAEYRGASGLVEAMRTFKQIDLYLPHGETVLSPEESALLRDALQVFRNMQARCRNAGLLPASAEAVQ